MILVYTTMGGTGVIDGSVSLGMFLNNIHIFTAIGSSWGSIYSTILDIMMIFPALERMTKFMNYPLDVTHRKLLNRHRRETTTNLRRKFIADPDDRLPVDRMPIVVGNLNFTYQTQGNVKNKVVKLKLAGVLNVQQGEFVAMMGPTSQGKSTLLKILGGEILCDAESIHGEPGGPPSAGGQFFVPSHLRVLRIDQPIFFRGSLLDNLNFGVAPGEEEHRRVLNVCDRLGLAKEVQEHFDSNDSHNWIDVFSQTQSQLASLARALITNPEILCIHKPTQVFDDNVAMQVSQVLLEFVEKKGIAQDDAKRHKRRPRTCIISTAQAVNIHYVHKCFQIDKLGIHPSDKRQAIQEIKHLQGQTHPLGLGLGTVQNAADMRNQLHEPIPGSGMDMGAPAMDVFGMPPGIPGRPPGSTPGMYPGMPLGMPPHGMQAGLAGMPPSSMTGPAGGPFGGPFGGAIGGPMGGPMMGGLGFGGPGPSGMAMTGPSRSGGPGPQGTGPLPIRDLDVFSPVGFG